MIGFYDETKSSLRDSFLSRVSTNVVHEKFLNLVGQTPRGGRILDLGTGNGYVPKEIERVYPKQYSLWGVDKSPEMLKRVKPDTGSVQYVVGDNKRLPFPGGLFLTVTAKNVTCFSATELARTLLPEGRFIFREYGQGKGLVEVARLFSNRLIRARKPIYYVDKLNAAGFEDINVEQFILQRQYTLEELLNIIQMFPFIENLGESDLEKIRTLFNGRKTIEINSDPFMLTARRKND